MLRIYNDKYIFVLISIILFFPKLTIIPLANYWQGIRIEDIIILFLLIHILTQPNFFFVFHRNIKNNFLLFIPFFFLSAFIGIINGFATPVVIILRLIEYCVLIIYFQNIKINYKKLTKVLYFFLIINFIISIFQYFEVIGHFSSKGYIEANSLYKISGLMSGTWELGFASVISYFIICESNKKKNFFFLIILILILLLGKTKGNIIAFFVCLFFFNLPKYKKIKIKLTSIVIIFILFLISIYILFNITNLNPLYLLEITKNFFIHLEVPEFDQNNVNYYSYIYRLENWLIFYKQFLTNIFTIFFGSGSTSIYYESFIIRILFSFGIFGTILVLILCKNIKKYILIFCLLSGITLDYIASIKLFFILFLYFKTLKDFEIYKNKVH